MEFAPIFVYLEISLLYSLISIGNALVCASSLAYPNKWSAYKCGFDPSDGAINHFDIRIYLVSI
jgi:NADH-ubiquinone oxidoreductase chain 3